MNNHRILSRPRSRYTQAKFQVPFLKRRDILSRGGFTIAPNNTPRRSRRKKIRAICSRKGVSKKANPIMPVLESTDLERKCSNKVE